MFTLPYKSRVRVNSFLCDRHSFMAKSSSVSVERKNVSGNEYLLCKHFVEQSFFSEDNETFK